MAFKTIAEISEASLTVERSRFIATAYPVKTDSAVAQILAARRKEYWDANHNVYAYRLHDGNISRFSDDGEPHSTAGKPVFDVLQGTDMTDCLLIVTRYFGGVLLGTGGLVRAYSSAAKLALENARVIVMRECVRCRINSPYPLYDKLSAFLQKPDICVQSTDFADSVTVELILPEADYPVFLQSLTEAFFGELSPKLIEKCNFAL